jgi:hypothetical protein
MWLCILLTTTAIFSVYWTIRNREIELECRETKMPFVKVNTNRRKGGDQRRPSFIRDFSKRITPPQETGDTNRRGSILIVPRRMSQNVRFRSFRKSVVVSKRNLEQVSDTGSAQDARDVLKAIEAMPSVTVQNVAQNAFGSRAVFKQAMYYTCAFYVSYTFATVNRIVQQMSGESYFPLLFLHILLLPLQGFFNVLVYRRNEYIRLMQRNPHMSKWDRFRRTWRWSFLGPPKEINDPMKSKDPEQPSVRKDPADSGKAADMKRPSSGLSFHINFAGEVSAGPKSTPRQETDPHDDNPLENRNDTSNDDFVNHVSDDMMDPMGAGVMDYAMMDLMASYADFPNMLTEDSVMMTMDAPQAFPTMIHATADFGQTELTDSGFFETPSLHQ